MQKVEIKGPNKRQTYCADISDEFSAIFNVSILFANLRREVIDNRVQQKELVNFDEEAIKQPITGKVEVSPFDVVFFAEFVKNENHRRDALPSEHG